MYKGNSGNSGSRGHHMVRLGRVAAAVATAFAAAGSVQAFEFDTGNEDLAVRWDNTVRYNVADRINSQNSALLKSPNNDDGNRNFDKGIVSNRLDVLSEFDVIYQKRFGFRLSAAGWYDNAYGSLDNNNLATSNHMVNGKPSLGLSDFTSRYNKGASGEILDAFVFGGFDIAESQLNFKLGKHTTFWGEAFFNPIHSLSYGQNPLDLRKNFAVPGTEAKELFVPRNAISASLIATPELSFQAQYFLDWNPTRLPDSGSYLGGYDMLMAGGDSLLLPGAQPGTYNRLVQGDPVNPKKTGDWGINSRWSPSWLDGTLGFYYRNTSDIQAQIHVAPAVAALPAAACSKAGYTPLLPTTCYINPGAASVPSILQGTIGKYYLVTPSDIDIFGISLSKNIEGISVGAEINYRHNMPLVSDPVNILPGYLSSTPGVIGALPDQGKTGGALGNTWHGVFNLLGTMASTPLFDAASWGAELQWNYLASVTQNEAVFKGRGSYTEGDKPTSNYWGLNLTFTPTWFQVFPGVDMSMPIAYGQGLSGNSVVSAGGNKGAGSYSVGVAADVYQKYRFDLKYTDYFGDLYLDSTGAVKTSAGFNALLKDRGFLSLTFKTTF
jgi:hypothetical protein